MLIQGIVGCGYPADSDGVDVQIVDPETCVICPPNRVGEIWCTSESKAAGYWDKPDVSSEAFAAIAKYSPESASEQNDGKMSYMHVCMHVS